VAPEPCALTVSAAGRGTGFTARTAAARNASMFRFVLKLIAHYRDGDVVAKVFMTS
jgi:hypothetical protein